MTLPSGDRGDLMTKDYLDAKFDAVDARFAAVDSRFDVFDAKLDTLRHELLSLVDRRLRAQTWMTAGLLLSGIGVAIAVGQAL